jgi:hypothetical protein
MIRAALLGFADRVATCRRFVPDDVPVGFGRLS